eukprot:1143032-Pelagomonas_calceolata.AAC.7
MQVVRTMCRRSHGGGQLAGVDSRTSVLALSFGLCGGALPFRTVRTIPTSSQEKETHWLKEL